MSVTPEQKHVINCILSIFETGKIPTAASYSMCTILSDGAGISYGKHQCTDKSGSLDLVVKKYIELKGVHAEALKAFLPALASNESSKVPPKGPWGKTVTDIVNLLKLAGQDPTMHTAQDSIFDTNYWDPAVNHAKSAGLTTALGHLICYDSTIHSGAGGVTIIRKRFPAASPANGGDEKEWCKAYVNARREWLAGNANPIVQNCVYRMDAIKKIMDEGNWDLKMPLAVRGVAIK